MDGYQPLMAILDELSDNPQVVFFDDDADSEDDNLSHLFCCNQDVSVCGRDLSGWIVDKDVPTNTPDFCVVCALSTKCPLCGDTMEPERVL